MAALVAAGIAVAARAPEYRSSASVTADARAVGTARALLASRALAHGVVDTLGLRIAIEEPERARQELLAGARVDSGAPARRYRISRVNGDRIAVQDLAARRVDTVAAGALVPIAGGTLRLAASALAHGPLVVRVLPYDDAVAIVRDHLVVGPSDTSAAILELAYAASESLLAVAVPNAVVDALVRRNADDVRATLRRATAAIDRQIDSLARVGRAQERSIAQLRRRRATSFEREGADRLREMQRLSELRTVAAVDRRVLDAALERLARADDTDHQELLRAQALTLPELLRATGGSLGTVFANELRKGESVTQVMQRARDSLSGELRGLDRRIASVKAARWRAASAEPQYQRLLREQRGTAHIVSQVQARRQEAVVSAAAQDSSIRVLDRAELAVRGDRNAGLVRIAWAIVAGILGGLGLAALRLRRLRQLPTRLAAHVLPVAPAKPDIAEIAGAPVLATVPLGPRTWRATLPDSYATIFERLHAAVPFEPPRVLVVTSAQGGEGKTMIVSMLARALARQGRRVLLVDAETRRSDVHAVFGIPAAPGFFDYLYGQSGASEAIQTVRMGDAETLDILPSGGAPNESAADLLVGGVVVPFFEQLREIYDYVLVDTPALDAFPDAALLGAHADATLLVVRDELAEEDAIRAAVLRLGNEQVTLTGVVRVSAAAPRATHAHDTPDAERAAAT